MSEAKWTKIVKDCRRLRRNMPEHSESSGGYYKDEPLMIDGDTYYNRIQKGKNKGKISPRPQSRMNKHEIYFNGCDADHNNDDLGHETFYLSRDGKNSRFCKTARKPYDLMVQACLLVAKYHNPNRISIDTDGWDEDWEVAIAFVKDVLGYTIENPFPPRPQY